MTGLLKGGAIIRGVVNVSRKGEMAEYLKKDTQFLILPFFKFYVAAFFLLNSC